MHMTERPNLSDEVAGSIRERIVDGRLADGQRLNEVHLAAELGISRTPLREALGRLVAEGALEGRPRHGYFVRPLSVGEFEQITAIRPILDPAALRLAGLPRPAQIARLEKLNSKLAMAAPTAALALDDAWHLLLLAHCPNRELVALIETMMRRTRRYELALLREAGGGARAGDEHARIVAALRAGELEAACAALHDNMTGGKAPVIAWLTARNTPKGARR